MPDAASKPAQLVSARRIPMAAMIGAGLAGLLLAATVALWVHYGSAVFYEMLLTGLAACF